VLGRRKDGLHALESLVAPISLADEVTVSRELRDETHAERDVLRVYGLPPCDLAARAAREYGHAHGIVGNILVGLNKNIPTAAGLGGGSSDAAAVLALLEAHFGRPAPLGLPFALGCDVPFFRQSTPAWVTGAGEHVAPVKLPRIALVVATPAAFLLTKDVFAAWDAAELTRGTTNGNNSAPCNSREAPGDVQHFSGVTDVAAWIRRVGNDLRGVSIRLCAEVEPLEAMLVEGGALAVSMSGSGPSVFGVFASQEHARQVAEAIRARGCPFAEAVSTVKGPWGTFEE
jgi:4-diphosphocytidyl-2-C-methyl-D-erythritol kinase